MLNLTRLDIHRIVLEVVNPLSIVIECGFRMAVKAAIPKSELLKSKPYSKKFVGNLNAFCFNMIVYIDALN